MPVAIASLSAKIAARALPRLVRREGGGAHRWRGWLRDAARPARLAPKHLASGVESVTARSGATSGWLAPNHLGVHGRRREGDGGVLRRHLPQGREGGGARRDWRREGRCPRRGGEGGVPRARGEERRWADGRRNAPRSPPPLRARCAGRRGPPDGRAAPPSLRTPRAYSRHPGVTRRYPQQRPSPHSSLAGKPTPRPSARAHLRGHRDPRQPSPHRRRTAPRPLRRTTLLCHCTTLLCHCTTLPRAVADRTADLLGGGDVSGTCRGHVGGVSGACVEGGRPAWRRHLPLARASPPARG